MAVKSSDFGARPGGFNVLNVSKADQIAISGGVLLGLCFDRKILNKDKLASWGGISSGDARIFISNGELKLRNLHSNFIALKLIFRDIQKNGLRSLEAGSNSLPGDKGICNTI